MKIIEVFTLKIEAMPGTSIDNAFLNAVELAQRIGISVEFQFNDVTCFVSPKGNYQTGVESYQKAIKSKTPHKFAMC